MYLAAIVLLMLVLPGASVLVEKLALGGTPGWMALVGKWFVFWAVGVRLLLAGLVQTLRPQFTAGRIFDTWEPGVLGIVREVGFGNIAMGTIGLLSLWFSGWLLPAAVAGGLYFGLAGLGHVIRGSSTSIERIATTSDLFIFAVLAAFVLWSST